MNKAMTLDNAADLYDQRNGGRRARTLPIEHVLSWLETQTDVRYCPKSDEFYHESTAEV